MTINFLHSRKSKLLVLALPICATLMSGTALAVDAVGGSASNINVTVPSAAVWTVLTSVNFANPTQRFCTATGSADAFRPSTVNGQYQYRFTVSNSPNPPIDQGQERILEFWNQAGIWDNSIKEITTTGGWMSNVMANPGYFTVAANPILFGSRTLYFLARKVAVAAPNLVVADASMTVTCTDNKLAPPLIIPIPLPPVLTLPVP
ncbi:MAG: hypothetical protein HOP23_00750 [Methylococcaceae bacterium]|nr:hypothetical protein [Methylococcaceae bacterium]